MVAKDWTGFENENWRVHSKGSWCDSQRKYLWVIECLHCGNTKERRTLALKRSKSCGCMNPPPANKGMSKLDDSDKVAGYWLLRKAWTV